MIEPNNNPATQMPQSQENPLEKYMRVPQIYITLPSGGKYWKPSAIAMPVNGDVPVHSMSSYDELVLKSPDALMNGQGVADVIQSCIKCIKDAWEMPVTDLDTCLIAIRIATYGESMEYSSACPECKEFNEYEIDLKEFLSLPVDLSAYDNPMQYETLTVKLKPRTFKDQNASNIEIFEQQRIVSVSQSDDLDTETKQKRFSDIFKKITELSLANVTGSIESITVDNQIINDKQVIKNFIENADLKVYKAIEKFHNLSMKAVPDKTIHTECPECKHKYSVPFTFDQSNFFALAF